MKYPENWLQKGGKHKNKKLNNKFSRDDVWAEIESRGFTDITNVICEECYKRPAVDVHHRIHRSQLGTGDRSNMVFSCRQCHIKHH